MNSSYIFSTRAFAALLSLLTVASPSSAQNVKGEEPNRGGSVYLEAQDPEVAKSRLHLPEGFSIDLFATEKEFPIPNPVSLTFDGKGRLWVATMPAYPQRLPHEEPNDTIVILEDTNRDGKADKHTVFIDGLHVPTGFELGDGGVYIAQQPNLMFAKDTDGDDVADVREIILHGFGTEDSHHSISAFTWGPGGGLYFQEGTFHHSQVETPYGPVRLVDAGVFRYKPDTYRLDVFVSYPFANPWGHIFDSWGQNFIADASGGSNYYGAAISGNIVYPNKRSGMRIFTSVVRPTAGCEIVSSRHFPDEMQGNFILNNCIGFQGIKNHKRIEEGSGFWSEEQENLLWSEDINFRPVDLQFGPDGALYIVDWFNPKIGHMQYSLRDEGRDHSHGRIWRITYDHKPLLKPVDMTALSTRDLLDQLKAYEDRTRYRARSELRSRDRDEVISELRVWMGSLSTDDENYEHNMLEALWIFQGHSTYDIDHLERTLNSPEPKARAAAVRVLRYWRYHVPHALSLLQDRINDEHPRVRLEALLTLSFFMQPEAAELAMQARAYDMDYYLHYVLNETITTLAPAWQPAMAAGELSLPDIKGAEKYLVDRVDTETLATFQGSPIIFKELIARHDTTHLIREIAVRRLAAMEGMSKLEVLLATMDDEDSISGERGDQTLEAVSKLILASRPIELKRVGDTAEKMATTARNPITRQTGLAMMIRGSRATDRAWEIASAKGAGVADYVQALPRTNDDRAVQGAFDHVFPYIANRENPAPIDGVRYVRIELPGANRVLTVAEIEVMSGGKNVALGKAATQSSVAHGGVPERAVDGNNDAKYSSGTQTHTKAERTPWIEIDLGKPYPVEAVHVWRRTGDGPEAARRLEGFRMRWLDADRNELFADRDISVNRREIVIRPLDAIRRVIIDNITMFRGHDEEIAKVLADYAIVGDLIDSATRALNKFPAEAIPPGVAPQLGDRVVAAVGDIAMADLSTDRAQQLFALGSRVATILPEDAGATLATTLTDRNVTMLTIRPVPHRMLYDKTSVTVPAGRAVEITLNNVDIMPHNIVITAQDGLNKVGTLSETLSTDPDFIKREYVPDVPDVLFATGLVQPGAEEKLVFRAPETPGEYPYVCTFPGHWLTMRGVMNVVEDFDATVMVAETVVEEPVDAAQRPFVADWTLDDVLPGIASVTAGRSFEKGKALFTAVGCNACHIIQGEGLAIGPDLTNINEKYDAEQLVTHIMDPSKEVADEYRSFLVETVDFDSYSGFLVKETDEEVRLRANITDPTEITVIRKVDIDIMEPSRLSAMPQGLFMTMQIEEIYELIAYLLAGGDPGHEIYK